MRLIDADVMRQEWLENGENEYVYDTNSILDSIDRQLTINPEDFRPKGKWIDRGAYVTTAYGSLSVYRCSVCNNDITIDEYDTFCPSCGAKMEGYEIL